MAPVTRFPWSPTTIGGVGYLTLFHRCCFLFPFFLVLCGLGMVLNTVSLFTGLYTGSFVSFLPFKSRSLRCALTLLCNLAFWSWLAISRECDNSFLPLLEWCSLQHKNPMTIVKTRNPIETMMKIIWILHLAIYGSFLLTKCIAWHFNVSAIKMCLHSMPLSMIGV